MRLSQSRGLMCLLPLLCLASNVYAVDGVVLIDQARAMAGSVSPGDTPGFPVTITQKGSYKLSGNLTVPDGNTTAIEIRSSFVTLDLNGFSIIGPTDCSGGFPCAGAGTGSGIVAGDPNVPRILFNIAIRNGTIQGMGASGLCLWGDAFTVENLTVRSNGSTGIALWRDTPSAPQRGVIVRYVNAHLNGGDGITVQAGTVSDCTASENHVTGIFVNMGVVQRNVMLYNAKGLSVGPRTGIAGNTMSLNGTDYLGSGISLGPNVCGAGLCP
jgi:hypothetical protein